MRFLVLFSLMLVALVSFSEATMTEAQSKCVQTEIAKNSAVNLESLADCMNTNQTMEQCAKMDSKYAHCFSN